MSSLLLYPSRPLLVHKLDQIRKRDAKTWRLQFKFNGHHAIVSTHEPSYIHSRHGTPLASAAKTDFSTECMKIFGMDCILDGELVQPAMSKLKEPIFIIWDIIVYKGKDLAKEMYAKRLSILARYWSDFKDFSKIRLRYNIYTAGIMEMSQLDAAALYCSKGSMIEGLVAKNLSHDLNWSRVKQIDTTNQMKWRAP